MSRVSKHIKQESLKNIVLEDLDCEEKLNKIKELLGLPISEINEANEETNETSAVVDEQANSRIESRSRILQGLKGKELKLAQQLLTEIEKSTFLDWNDDTLELSVDGEYVAHSNIHLLTTKLVHDSSPQIPLGFVTYIDGLLRLKIPLSYFRDSDAIQTREALIKIKSDKSLVEADRGNLKRQRSLSETEEGNIENKKQRVEEEEIDSNVSDLNLTAPTAGDTQRRSPRLQMKKKLNSTWKRFDNS